MKLHDLTGKHFNRLTVLRRAENRGAQTAWKCRCLCGVELDVQASHLKTGHTRSCGCERAERSQMSAGEKFYRLTTIEPAGRDKPGHALWLCRCSCGKELPVRVHNLKKGYVRSCGCLQRDNRLRGKHGHCRAVESSTFTSWRCMIQRCTNPNATQFKHYGGAGVKVASEWMTFENFLRDMGDKPEGTTLSRFADSGNYENGNCAWHTWFQQRAEAKKKLRVASVALAQAA